MALDRSRSFQNPADKSSNLVQSEALGNKDVDNNSCKDIALPTAARIDVWSEPLLEVLSGESEGMDSSIFLNDFSGHWAGFRCIIKLNCVPSRKSN